MGNGWRGAQKCARRGVDESRASMTSEPFVVGQFRKIFDQGVDRLGRQWHVNDHCFVRGPDGTWHMFGIAAPDPPYHDLPGKGYFTHGTAQRLFPGPWMKQEVAMRLKASAGETVLWAPHVVSKDDVYYMFYCSGGEDPRQFGISVATSSDLWHWRRRPRVLFRDGYHARDPMVLYVPRLGKWVMYYCTTDPPSGGQHVVAYRTSEDLLHWGERAIAYRDSASGTAYGPTESPFVVARGAFFFLFIGPRPYKHPTKTTPDYAQPGYVGTDVFRSGEWNHWDARDLVAHISAHAAEVACDEHEQWYVSSAGIRQGGLYLAPIRWADGAVGRP
jgi:beta-fructofuranosidase